MSGAVASTLTHSSVPRAGARRYTITAADSATFVVPTTVADDVSERALVSRLWAEDWDSAEDAEYDRL